MRKNWWVVLLSFLIVTVLWQVTALAVGQTAGGEHGQAIVTMILLLAAAVMFLTEIVPLPVTAILVPVALSFPGIEILSAAKAFSFFGDKWVVIFMAMFMVGEATFRTGFADLIGRSVVKLAGHSEMRLLVLVMLAVGLMSSLLSNTGTAAVFIPIVLGVCKSARMKPGKILMPMAFASSLGGCMTVIGTPPNGIINSTIENALAAGTLSGVSSFGFFEFAKTGLLLFVIGILYYVVIGHQYLPEADGDSSFLKEKSLIVYRREKMPVAIIIFLFVVVMMAGGWIDLATASMLGAALVVITGCITMREAFGSISWTTIFLFAGMLALAEAMSVSGAAALIAGAVVRYVHSPFMLLMAAYIVTALLTQFMSNTATAALMAPIGLAMAQGFGISPLPILLTISLASSACFLTPIATPPNTLVLGPGGYQFADYAKAGWGLQLVTAIAIFIIVPILYPF